MRLSVIRWLRPVPSSLVLQFVYGLLFANGVFASVHHDPDLTKAIGLSALSTAIGITVFGILLSSPDRVGNANARTVALLGAGAISAQLLMAGALLIESKFLLFSAAAVLGVGSGSVYVVSIVVLQAWVPEAAGMVTGLGLLVGGAGTLFGIWAFHVAIDLFQGVIPAMALAGACSGALSLGAALFIESPAPGWSPLTEIDDYLPLFSLSAEQEDSIDENKLVQHTAIPASIQSDESKSLLPHKEKDPEQKTRLSIRDILTDPAFFFVFMSVSAAVGPGFGFVLAFPRMVNTLFGADLDTANTLLLWVTLVGVVGRILIGLAIDLLESPTDSFSNGFLGAKRVNVGVLGLQSIALASMPLCIRYGSTNSFALATSVVYVTFSGGAVLSACLARSIFSPENSTLVFALLGIAVGIGRALFAVIVASCGNGEAKIVASMASRRIYEYDFFVHASFMVSTFGLICSYFVSPSKTVYRNGVNSPVFTDLRA